MSELIAASIHHATRYEASELFHLATHDPLTGLPNRALFFRPAAPRHGQRPAPAPSGWPSSILDMDGLKPINDNYGHRAGDAAIRQVAARIRKISRQSDTVARLGGDEFGVVLSRVADRAGVAAHGDRLADTIAAPFEFEEKEIRLGASIGMSLFPEDGEDLELLIEKADHSMYSEKRGRVVPTLTGAARRQARGCFSRVIRADSATISSSTARSTSFSRLTCRQPPLILCLPRRASIASSPSQVPM